MDILANNWRPLSLGFVFGTLAFALYAEFGPGMGHVWIRPNETGNKVLTLSGLGALMREPFKNKEMWRPRNFDINYPIVSITSSLFAVGITKLVYLI
jgi:hypothetical protein